MLKIPLMLIVNPKSRFLDCYNKLVSQEHPVPLAYKLMDISEIFEKEQQKYKKLYEQKAKTVFISLPTETSPGEVDEEKKKIAEAELTEFARSTMIEVPEIGRDEISHAKMEPEELRILKQLIP